MPASICDDADLALLAGRKVALLGCENRAGRPRSMMLRIGASHARPQDVSGG